MKDVVVMMEGWRRTSLLLYDGGRCRVKVVEGSEEGGGRCGDDGEGYRRISVVV